MSKSRRRNMMQMESDPIPRERLVFSHAGDVIVGNFTKVYDGAAIFGLAIIQVSPTNYGVYIVRTTVRNGYTDWNARNALTITNGVSNYDPAWAPGYLSQQLTIDEKVMYLCNCVRCTSGDSVAAAKAAVQAINSNGLLVLNDVTGVESYTDGTGYSSNSSQCFSIDAYTDLVNYYYGVI